MLVRMRCSKRKSFYSLLTAAKNCEIGQGTCRALTGGDVKGKKKNILYVFVASVIYLPLGMHDVEKSEKRN